MSITKILVCAAGIFCEERRQGDGNEDAFDRRKWIIILSIKEIKPESRSQRSLWERGRRKRFVPHFKVTVTDVGR